MTKLRKYGIIFLVLLMALVTVFASSALATTSDDLKTAFSSGGSIKLDSDVAMGAETLNLSADKSLTLDLAGFTISADERDDGVIIVDQDKSSLTIIDSSSANTGKITRESDSKYYGVVRLIGDTTVEHNSPNNVSVTIESGTIVSPYYSVVVKGKGAVLTVNGGTIEATDSTGCAISGNGRVKDGRVNNGGTEINITGGKLIGGTESGGNAIYHPQLGTLNISGGELSGYDGIQFKSGSLKLLGGTITATGAKVTPVANDNGAVGTGAALSLITSSAYIGSMDVVIAGTAKLEATGTGASAVYEGIHETGDTSSASELKKFAVSSGTLISSGDALSFTSEGIEEVITITGGIYSSDPTEYVAEGYEVVPVGDMWQVQKTQPVGPVTPVIEPIAPVLPDVSDDVKEEVKPVVGATETDTAEAAAKLDGITEDMLEIDKDEIVAVKADTVVKVVENIATLENVTSADVLPLPVFTAKVESKKTVMISFSLAGADLKAAKPEDVKVLKVLGADSGRLFKYASDITADMDEKFTIQKVDGTIFKGAIEGSETYILSIFIKDGGAFDLDEADGSVADPVAILATKTVEPHHSSSSGCNAGFAGLLLLAAVSFIYRRKR